MELTNDPAKSAEADARVLEAAGAVLLRRYGAITSGDLVRALDNRAQALHDEAKALREAAGPQAPAEGWGVIRPGDRKAHYYVNGMALCRRVGFYSGPLDTDEFVSPDEHKECRRLLGRRQPVAGS